MVRAHAVAGGEQNALAVAAIDQPDIAVEVVAGGQAAVIGNGIVPIAAGAAAVGRNVRIAEIGDLRAREILDRDLAEMIDRVVAQADDEDPRRRFAQVAAVAH